MNAVTMGNLGNPPFTFPQVVVADSQVACVEKTLVLLATYNEVENLPTLLPEIFRYAPDVDILVVDDGSPDGTGQWCDEEAEKNPRVSCLHRAGKLGLGSAIACGMRHAIEQGYTYVINMDADLSHQPEHLPALREAMGTPEDPQADVVVGSRYVAGGKLRGWPLSRLVMSRAVNLSMRTLLGLPVRDCSGSYRCYRMSVLKDLDFDALHSQGYSFLEEVLWHLHQRGAVIKETPITFVDRRQGESKVNAGEVREMIGMLWQLCGQKRRARRSTSASRTFV